MSKNNIKIKMTPEQYQRIKKFLNKHQIFLDGKTTFGLVAQPFVWEKVFKIYLFSPKQCAAIEKAFNKINKESND